MGVYIKGINLPKEVGNVISITLYDKKDNWLDNIEVYRKNIIEIDLVRCKDCKHYDTDSRTFPCCTDIFGAVRYMESDGFCSKGERRADNERL